MIRFIAVAFVLAVATSAQAMSPPPLHQADGMITQVRQACGAGMKWNNALGRCATTSARRHVRRGVVTALKTSHLRMVGLPNSFKSEGNGWHLSRTNDSRGFALPSLQNRKLE